MEKRTLVTYEQLTSKAARKRAMAQLRRQLNYKPGYKIPDEELLKALFDKKGNIYAW